MEDWMKHPEFSKLSPIKQELLHTVQNLMQQLQDIRGAVRGIPKQETTYIEKIAVEKIEMGTGNVTVRIQFAEKFYYEVLSELTGTKIHGEYELISVMKELASMKEEYTQIKDAFADVRMKGYGVVSPKKEEVVLEEPVIIRQGNKFGVKIRSKSPSIHMIRANIETEIAPIVGTEQQAKDLIQYIGESGQRGESIWETNIFGKSIEQLVQDGIRSKITAIGEESQSKLQDTMQKIVNDSKGGLVCIII